MNYSNSSDLAISKTEKENNERRASHYNRTIFPCAIKFEAVEGE